MQSGKIVYGDRKQDKMVKESFGGLYDESYT
jgi:hypothetical protein